MIRRKTLVITTTGVAGSAAGNVTLALSRPAIIRFIQVDYHASAPATTDLTIKADTSAGATIFTKANTNTDFGPSAVATAGIDETGAATAATDVGAGGLAVTSGIYAAIAQGDALTACATVYLWIEQ